MALKVVTRGHANCRQHCGAVTSRRILSLQHILICFRPQARFMQEQQMSMLRKSFQRKRNVSQVQQVLCLAICSCLHHSAESSVSQHEIKIDTIQFLIKVPGLTEDDSSVHFIPKINLFVANYFHGNAISFYVCEITFRLVQSRQCGCGKIILTNNIAACSNPVNVSL